MTAPHDLNAEEALVGAMLLSPTAIRSVADSGLGADDFYRPAHGHIFHAVMTLYTAGTSVDPVTVADELRRHDLLDAAGGEAELVLAMNRTPASSSAPHYARIIAEMAALRRIMALASEIGKTAQAIPSDVPAFVEDTRERVARLQVVTHRVPPVMWDVTDFVKAVPVDTDREWLIEPFLERRERMLIVAAAGIGKSVFMRQVAIASACGVNPFLLEEMKPLRTLTVDLENPDGILRRSLARMDRLARQRPLFDQHRAALWHEPTGINLRSPAGLDAFDQALAWSQPDLVAIGPLYKLFRKEPRESDEEAALDVLARLDDLRGRYGFAVVIEHHAPHGTELRPFGSSVLQRWPEFGPALSIPQKADDGDRSRLEWGEWRGPREIRPWPRTILHGGPMQWPWVSAWDEGRRPVIEREQELW